MDMAEEKRKFVRLNALVDVVYNRISPSVQTKLSLVKNISKGGICLIAYEELKEQDMVDLKMFLPQEEKPIQAVGRIAWIKEFSIGNLAEGRRFDVGVEFVEIKDEDAARIGKYVFAHLK